ncbi:hypothetical protein ACHAWU_001375 [Discostella pseudostelligera]|uniref:ABC transporter domain-containing protein n=1 Tax=Discostella pseudostelligera TaxID=259834 RepID=A0ABD3MGR6_9STRA
MAAAAADDGESGTAIDRDGTNFASSHASRPDYLSSLRRGRITCLRLEDSSPTFSSSLVAGGAADASSPRNDAAAATATTDTATSINTAEVDITEFRRRLSTIRDAKSKRRIGASIVGGGGKRAPTLQKVEVRIKDYSYHVPVRVDAPSIKTVFNTSPCYVGTNIMKNVVELITGKRQWKDIFGHYEEKYILKHISLVLKPGRTYLVMGPPGCGKTSLLKAIAGRLKNSSSSKSYCEGRIEYNGVSMEDAPDMVLQNIVSYVGQLDNHAPFLTVQETFDFAANCRIGVDTTTRSKKKKTSTTARTCIGSEDVDSEQILSENLTIDGLDLAVCRDTYVGDANNRGVSGGQRRRVTLGEMMVEQNPVACADEISTGLDAAVTYDISSSIVSFAKAAGTTRIVSLLQPGPETFSLFDEVILLAEGHLIYAGPIEDVLDYFSKLGYRPPNTMDVADFLQSVATPDGEMMFNANESPMDKHYSAPAFAEAFRSSDRHKEIAAELSSPVSFSWNRDKLEDVDEERPLQSDGDDQCNCNVPEDIKHEYSNPFWTSVRLNVTKNLTLLKRDKEFLIGKTIENFGMGIGMAMIFLQSAAFPSSINDSDSIADFFTQGCPDEVTPEISQSYNKLLAGTYSSIFLTSFHILLGTLTGTPDEVDGRLIYYKHADARFFQAGAFLLGKQISQLPLLAMEIIAFGLPFYFIAGLAYEARAFFVFLAILIAYKFSLKMLYGVLAQTLPKKANVQGVGTLLYLLLTLTSGFIVFPSAIPSYWKWLFWANPMAWAQQGMASNQFLSSKFSGYSCDVDGVTFTLGQAALDLRGWHEEKGWIGYTFAFLVPYTLLFGFVTWYALRYIRIEPDRPNIVGGVNIGVMKKTEEFSIPFTPADVAFDNLVYEVTASTSKDKLCLLNEVSGVFRAGRMCALMGSSGAGKTTLMDVIAMRKTSGSITGKIELNGFEQERTSFLRSSGYVEQFDVQQPELTIRETVAFSARLRLDVKNPAIRDDATKMRFVDHILEIMELTSIQTLQVGSFEEGGLTFEQRKRLAIACELAGSPSVIFLDEPTSGLDSRGALVVIRAMRRIADSGRTVVATIHQPSSAVFELFDDLILLKKGGNVVFFGELGKESSKMIQYFEERGAKQIERQENPAAWVLRAYAGEHTSIETDWAELYKESEQYANVRSQIERIRTAADNKLKLAFSSTYSTPFSERVRLICVRMLTIYRRSAPYNMTRIVVAILYAFLLGSMFLNTAWRNEDVPWNEDNAAALIGTVFLSLNVIGTTAMTMAIPVAKRVRDVFYKHRASGMIGHDAMFIGMVVAELPYLLLMAVLYVFIYCATTGLLTSFGNFLWFVCFFLLHTASYSFFAQCFMCLVRDEKTVGALQGVWIGLNLFYAGFVVLPQNFFSFFWLGLWINASRYALEGIIFSQFQDITAPVVASTDSPFYFSLGCSNDDGQCTGSMIEFATFFFGDKFSASNRGIDVGILAAWNILALIGTWVCLMKFNYVNT